MFTVHGEAVVVELVPLVLSILLMLVAGSEAIEGRCSVGCAYPGSLVMLLETVAEEPSDAALKSVKGVVEGSGAYEGIEVMFAYGAWGVGLARCYTSGRLTIPDPCWRIAPVVATNQRARTTPHVANMPLRTLQTPMQTQHPALRERGNGKCSARGQRKRRGRGG